jgi:ABC-type transporter Mla MlaB component
MTLRIDISDERERVVLTLTGRIQADQIAELQRLLERQVPDHKHVVDLREVNLVDRDAVRFLAEIEKQGARLRNCSAFIREWISRERSGMRHTEDEQVKGAGE